MKILISDTDSNHANSVEQAFLSGYQNYGQFNGEITIRLESASASLSYAYSNDYKIVIRSTTGLQSTIPLALGVYPDVQMVMPAGSNTFTQVFDSVGELPNIIVTGAGDSNNETGYDIEFFAPDIITGEPDYSSFSNGYIAGQLAYIADTLNVNLWTARYLARQAGSTYNNQDGYGIIDVPTAISLYDSEINYDELDPFQLFGSISTLNFERGDKRVLLTWGSVFKATNYNVYKSINGGNFVLLNSVSGTSYLDVNLSYGNYKYKIKANNQTEETEYSNIVEINIIREKPMGLKASEEYVQRASGNFTPPNDLDRSGIPDGSITPSDFSYKVYYAKVSLLNSTANCTATVFANTIGDIEITKASTGRYRFNLSGAFTATKTYVSFTNSNPLTMASTAVLDSPIAPYVGTINENYVELRQAWSDDSEGIPVYVDNIIGFLEIKVFQ